MCFGLAANKTILFFFFCLGLQHILSLISFNQCHLNTKSFQGKKKKNSLLSKGLILTEFSHFSYFCSIFWSTIGFIFETTTASWTLESWWHFHVTANQFPASKPGDGLLFLPANVLDFFGYTGFLPHPKNIYAMLSVDFKSSVGVSVSLMSHSFSKHIKKVWNRMSLSTHFLVINFSTQSLLESGQDHGQRLLFNSGVNGWK